MTLLPRHTRRGFALGAFALLSAHSAIAHAAGTCRYIEQASLDLSRSNPWSTPTVDGEINGKPVKMLLDTGASQTYIMRAEADRQNLNPERTRTMTQGVGGLTSIFLVRLKDFAIGNARATNLRFPVLETGNPDIAALIGADFLMQYDVELQLAENRVKLFRANDCQDKALAYWDQNAMAVPMELIDGKYSARVQVKINDVTLWALIDSGASRSFVDLSTARKLGFATDAPGVKHSGKVGGIGAEKRDSWNMTFDRFAIGDEVIQHPRIGVIDEGDGFVGRKPFQMVLGRDFLRSHRALLANSQLLFYFSYHGGTVFPAHDVIASTATNAAP
jgi:predicted aspartyl protease